MTPLQFWEKYGRIILPNGNSIKPWIRDADRAFFERVDQINKEKMRDRVFIYGRRRS